MLDWTDRHCRFFLRQISKRTLLYTEMVTTGALLHGDIERHLRFHPAEHPVALQLGGSNPDELAQCAKLGEDWGYDEINLNVGCPSDRVQSGRFGACLMAEPSLVAECMAAMSEAVSVPTTVKHRLGIDELDTYDHLAEFVRTVAAAGCTVFIAHARKAWLQGLSPKQNRDVPPLRYERVWQLKRDFPRLSFTLNGGLKTWPAIEAQLQVLDGVMIGREAYQNPWLLAEADLRVFGDASRGPHRHQVVRDMIPYVRAHLAEGGRLQHITRHMLGLFQGQPGAKRWRRHLAENAHLDGATEQVLLDAAALVPRQAAASAVTL